MDLQILVRDANRTLKLFASRLEKLGIYTLSDLLLHIPSRYVDYSIISNIAKLQEGETVTIQGHIVSIKNEYTRTHKIIQKAVIADTTGSIDVTWFNQPFLTKYFNEGDRISLSGTISLFHNSLTLQSPEYELIPQNSPKDLLHTGRLVPIYPETYRVSSKWLRRQIATTLKHSKEEILEYLPDSILKTYRFPTIFDSLEQIHFPTSKTHAEKAKERLSFDEVFLLQLQALLRRSQWKKKQANKRISLNPYREKIEAFLTSLPFTLTNAQKKAVGHIFSDLSSEQPMNRLLEGDVGSGKTVVATISMYLFYLNGYQSVLMAPTEILAVQHYETISVLLSPLGIRVGLATGSKRVGLANETEKKSIQKNSNSFDILVGTHAVLSKKINFDTLALVVIDEQQRFGVEQRSILRQKGANPHLLTMTATPIPRTIALTLYGDLDLSYLDEMPKGRKIIKTWLVPKEKRNAAYQWIEKKLKETDSQAFVICPFIEASESMQTVKAAVKEFDFLQKHIFPNLRLGLLHGKLSAKEKERVLRSFRKKDFDILVASPVVEVGIDIPNATIMVIEAAERFGLAQLHQLRGRVGRGEKQSFCLLFTESTSPKTLQRLKAMERMHVGAVLAELDFKLRGPGELYGTLQHGMPKLKVASFSDTLLLIKARHEAEAIFPKLSSYKALEKKVSEQQKIVSPD